VNELPNMIWLGLADWVPKQRAHWTSVSQYLLFLPYIIAVGRSNVQLKRSNSRAIEVGF